jgi:hypothetical protein
VYTPLENIGGTTVSDAAYQNAVKRRDELAAKINQLNQELDTARKELQRVDGFIQAWREFAGMDEDTSDLLTYSAKQKNPAAGESVSRPDNPPRELVGDKAEEIIVERNKPVSRSDLFNALKERGIEIKGKEPEMVLSTMLWRMPDRFVRLRGYGYWLKGRPYPPAAYAPSPANVMD